MYGYMYACKKNLKLKTSSQAKYTVWVSAGVTKNKPEMWEIHKMTNLKS